MNHNEYILDNCQLFCENYYELVFGEYIAVHSRNDKMDRDARRKAIIETAIAAREKYSELPPSVIWRFVQKAHIKKYAGVDIDTETIELINSARQSWVKSSGHAFEEMVKKECNEALDQTDIVVLLQRDLTELLSTGKVSNYIEDLDWLREECRHDVFDLFVGRYEEKDKVKIFGCIQAKTSIRDRVTRDREPSIRAMERKFWSVIFIFDDGFLQMPKFISMVNGGSQEFPENGWHVAYNYGDFHKGRIKSLRSGMDNFVEDAIAAEYAFNGERRSFVTTHYPFKS